jgi:indole-3-glycerol phosphate synthase
MPASLDSIVAAARKRLVERRQAADLRSLERSAEQHVPRGFRQRLQLVSRESIAVIAELKRASPSKGLIRSNFDPAALARDLAQAGAAALSVLTDEEFFQGSLTYLRQASVASGLPCLRKDFIVDEFQIVEARANSADAVLLIVAALSEKELRMLAACAVAHQLDALCEVHDEGELERAIGAGCDLIGVNSRDLRTFDVSLETAFRLAEKIPGACLAVAESGIHSGSDLMRLHGAGYHAFLIGESLMKQPSPGEALTQLFAEAEQAPCPSKHEGFGSKFETRGSKLPL